MATTNTKRKKTVEGLVQPSCISNIYVEKLFGYYKYELELLEGNLDSSTRFNILYGNNGAGKTTLLKLTFCLLSPIGKRGDKSYIAETPFSKLVVEFDNGTRVIAERSKGELTGSFNLKITNGRKKLYSTDLIANEDNAIRTDENPKLQELHNNLRLYGIFIYFLPDDRSVKTFSEEENAYSEKEYYEEGYTTLSIRRALQERHIGETTHHLDISPILRNVNEWIRKQIISGSYSGEENANSIYLKVLNRIARPQSLGSKKIKKRLNQSEMEKRLISVAERSMKFAQYGFASDFPAKKFISALNDASKTNRSTIMTVLDLRVDGIEARLNAIDETFNVLSTFINTINAKFFTNKKIRYNVEDGIYITDYLNNHIAPNHLSSGEKQILLLLCNTLLARDKATVFLIDEPELSLNIKWQRQLIDSLIKCSKGSNIQYILASHSLEVLSKHQNHVMHLQ